MDLILLLIIGVVIFYYPMALLILPVIFVLYLLVIIFEKASEWNKNRKEKKLLTKERENIIKEHIQQNTLKSDSKSFNITTVLIIYILVLIANYNSPVVIIFATIVALSIILKELDII